MMSDKILNDESLLTLMSDIGNQVNKIQGKDFIPREYINVYIPRYIQTAIISDLEKYCLAISRDKTFQIFGCNVIDGYENKIVVANTNTCTKPERIIKYEVNLQ